MDLGEKIIDCNNEEHLVGFKITEKNVEYIITIERRFFRKENNNYIECFENNASTKYSAPATSDDSFYAIFVGGNGYYHIFAVLEVESNG